MGKVMNTLIAGIGHRPLWRVAGPIVMLALATAPAAAEINLEMRPSFQIVYLGLDDTVEIGLYAVSDDETDQLLSALDAVIQWQPGFLQMVGNVEDNMDLMFSGYFLNDPYGLNEADPPKDGDGYYTAWAMPGVDLPATPEGTLITKFVFEPLAVTPGTPFDIPATGGDPPGETVVWSGDEPNTPVTGTLSGAVVEIKPCCPADLDYDCFVGIIDFLMLLAAWGPCPDPCPPPCLGDLDGDCEVGIIDFLMLLAAWGPCP
jgi:hypothetical protein